MVDDWPSRQLWCLPTGKPNLHWMCEGSLSQCRVPVDALPSGTTAGYGEAQRVETCLREFAQWWLEVSGLQQRGEGQPRSLAANVTHYLRDWHLYRDYPSEAARAYSSPPLFGLDWLNEWWRVRSTRECLSPEQTPHPNSEETAEAGLLDMMDKAALEGSVGLTGEVRSVDVVGSADEMGSAGEVGSAGGVTHADDFRFVYMGPRGSWTALHHDVLLSNSWSANICGRKRWLLFPPSVSHHLRDSTGVLVSDAQNGSQDRWPNLHLALEQSIEVEQLAGEVIFVPSGWFHQAITPNITHAHHAPRHA